MKRIKINMSFKKCFLLSEIVSHSGISVHFSTSTFSDVRINGF